jgi:hypothetical protein
VNEHDPYEPPRAEVRDPSPSTTSDQWELVEPQRVRAGRGWGWIADGFRLFAKTPLVWLVNVLIFLAIIFVLSLVPFLSLAVNFLGPIFIGGFMRGCRVLDEGQELEVNHLFAGFKENTGKLAGLGGFYLLAWVVIAIIVVAFFFTSADLGTLDALEKGEEVATDELRALGGPELGLAILVGLGLAVPVLMGYWFAPTLIMLHDLGVIESIKLSFRGCMRNIWPFLIYGAALTVLSLLAIVPLLLGFLVLTPVFIASVYIGYKDIYLSNRTDRRQF